MSGERARMEHVGDVARRLGCGFIEEGNHTPEAERVVELRSRLREGMLEAVGFMLALQSETPVAAPDLSALSRLRDELAEAERVMADRKALKRRSA